MWTVVRVMAPDAELVDEYASEDQAVEQARALDLLAGVGDVLRGARRSWAAVVDLGGRRARAVHAQRLMPSNCQPSGTCCSSAVFAWP